MSNPFVLTWTPRIDGASLVFDYRLENRSADDVWALDVLMVFGQDGFTTDPEATIVRDDEAHAGRALLTRASVPPVRSLPEIVLRPVARRLAAGAAVEGRGRAPWPLTGVHPHDGTWPLREGTREAVLEVGVLPGQYSLQELPLIEGGTASVPRPADAFQFQIFVRAPAFTLPAA